MENCFICGKESVKCEMSIYKPNIKDKEQVKLICPDCRNDINKG